MADAERELAAIRQVKAEDSARLGELLDAGKIPEAFSFVIARSLGASAEECNHAIEHIAQLRAETSMERPLASAPVAGDEDVPT